VYEEKVGINEIDEIDVVITLRRPDLCGARRFGHDLYETRKYRSGMKV
jgi:hypothetical protein